MAPTESTGRANEEQQREAIAMEEPNVQQIASDAKPESNHEPAPDLEDLQHLASELKKRLTAETMGAFKKILEESAPEPKPAPAEKVVPMVQGVIKDGLRIMVHPEPEPTKE
jgi:hypothetical protein